MQQLPVICESCKKHDLLWSILPADQPEQKQIQEAVLKNAGDREFILALGVNHAFKICRDCFDTVSSNLLGKAEGVVGRVKELKTLRNKD